MATSILLVDNRDSFTHNLAQLVRETGDCTCDIVRHDNIDLDEIAHHAGIIFSPGPGLPREFPEMFQILERYAGRIPILGVCLGHQAIAEFYGALLVNLPQPRHGERAELEIVDHDEALFTDVPDRTPVGLYHSWAVDERTLPPDLQLTARGAGVVLALRHRSLDIRSVQFHPESYMTAHGPTITRNWLTLLAASPASSRLGLGIVSSSLRR